MRKFSKIFGAFSIALTAAFAVAFAATFLFSCKDTVSPTNPGDTTAPIVSGGGTITTASVTDTTLTLNWTKASDNTTAGTGLKYYVWQNDNPFTMSGGLPVDGTLLNPTGTFDIATYDVTGLTASTT